MQRQCGFSAWPRKNAQTGLNGASPQPRMARPSSGGHTCYAIKVAPGIHHTMGGLVIDTEAHVLNENHQPIPGLFAAGDCVGGVLQIAKAVADGAIAGLNISEFLRNAPQKEDAQA